MEFPVKCMILLCLLLLTMVDRSCGLPQFASKKCKIPNGDAGTCTPLDQCPPLLNINNNMWKTDVETKFLRQSVALCVGGIRNPKVCCPPKWQWDNLVINPVVYEDNVEFGYHTVAFPSTTPTPPTTSSTTPTTTTMTTSTTTKNDARKDDAADSEISNYRSNSQDKLRETPDDNGAWKSKNKNDVSKDDTAENEISSHLSNSQDKPREAPADNEAWKSKLSTTTVASGNIIFGYSADNQIPIAQDASQENTCGVHSSSNRIVGGDRTDIDEYPWLALLQYTEPDVISCGGSLITDMFVLTAAHCLYTANGPPTDVRLSEYNISSFPSDTVEVHGGGTETVTVTVIPVGWYKQHPDPTTNDIGLIKMSRAAQFSDFIKTICLPTRNYVNEFTTGTEFVTAGWGSDNTFDHSEVKMDVTLPFVPESYCSEILDERRRGKYICAGGTEGKNTCRGDSGGPLMYFTETAYVLVGVVASGSSNCGSKDDISIYTNVYEYMEWIHNTMDSE